MDWRIYRSISARLRNSVLLMAALLCWCSGAVAQDTLSVEVSGDSITVKLPKKERKPREQRLLQGVAVGADLVGWVMKAAGADWAMMEVLARVNLKDKYFPIFELGLGEANHSGNDQDYQYNVRAPYFRVGMDYNINKKHNGNRMFFGLRYGFSFFNYDLTSPTPLTDPVWKESRPFDYESLHGAAHWGEIVFGLEMRLWKMIRLGWDARIKFRFTQKTDEVGPPWLIPGYGKNDTSGWGGTFKVLVEL